MPLGSVLRGFLRGTKIWDYVAAASHWANAALITAHAGFGVPPCGSFSRDCFHTLTAALTCCIFLRVCSSTNLYGIVQFHECVIKRQAPLCGISINPGCHAAMLAFKKHNSDCRTHSDGNSSGRSQTEDEPCHSHGQAFLQDWWSLLTSSSNAPCARLAKRERPLIHVIRLLDRYVR